MYEKLMGNGLAALQPDAVDEPDHDLALDRLLVAGNLMAAQIDVLCGSRHLDEETHSLLTASAADWSQCLRDLQRDYLREPVAPRLRVAADRDTD